MGDAVHFDDRLATVLRQRAAGERAARTQYRQLLDLLGQRSDGMADALEESGWERLSNLSEQIPSRERAAILREGGWRFRNPSLILFLAEQEPDVAASALSAVELSPEDWVLLIPELPIRARGFLRLRRDLPQTAQDVLDRLGVRDRGLPRPGLPEMAEQGQPLEQYADPLVPPVTEAQRLEARLDEPVEAGEHAERELSPSARSIAGDGEGEPGGLSNGAAPPDADDSIGALVRRIEAFQKARRAGSAMMQTGTAEASVRRDDASCTGAAGEEERAALTSFDFATDARGHIEWATPAAAPMLVGTAIRQWAQQDSGRGDAEFAFVHRLPLRHVRLEITGASLVEGEWVLDAMPRFAEDGGSFRGYLGRCRRPVEVNPDRASAAQDRADRLRQLLHELRTPVNAIQGFAEFIQQQMVGRTPHAYRALAAAIGSDSARILSGFDDLERLTRLEGGSAELAEGSSELHDKLAATVRQLRPTLQARGAGFDLVIRAVDTLVPLSPLDAELLLWRVVASIAAGARDGEIVEIELQGQERKVALSCDLPRDLRERDDLFATDFRLDDDTLSPGVFGAGFALRLARAEARAVGGDLRREGGRLILTLPTASAAHGPAIRSAA